MKQNIHPKYQDVLFVDSSTGFKFVCGSTVQTKLRETHEGKEYPAVHVAISSSSHPFFVGGKQFVDSEGRVDKFTKRYQAKQPKQQQEDKQQENKQQDEQKPTAKAKKTTRAKKAAA